jgi:hypothetical protein
MTMTTIAYGFLLVGVVLIFASSIFMLSPLLDCSALATSGREIPTDDLLGGGSSDNKCPTLGEIN